MYKYKLKALLISAGIKGYELAAKLGVTKESVSEWCNIKSHENKSIKADYMREIAAIIPCTMEDIFNNPLQKKDNEKA